MTEAGASPVVERPELMESRLKITETLEQSNPCGSDDSTVAGAWAETLRAFASRDRLARQLEEAKSVAMQISVESGAAAADCCEILEAFAQGLGRSASADEQPKSMLKQEETRDAGEFQEIKSENDKLKRELNVAKKRFEKEEKLAAERGADIEDLRERLLSMEKAASCFESETSAAELREKSMREELAAKTREIEAMNAAGVEAEGLKHDEAEGQNREMAAAAHTADIDRIFSAVFGNEDAGDGELKSNGGIHRSEAKGSIGGEILEASEVSVALKDSHEAHMDNGGVGKGSLSARTDRICEEARELRIQLTRERDEATALRADVSRLREALAKVESEAADAKGQARRLQEQVKQLQAAEADAQTAPPGLCHCLG